MVDVSKNLPRYYDKSRYVKSLYKPVNIEFERLYALVDLFVRNRFVNTADETAVKNYEQSLGIQVTNDTYEVRKSRIKARMRGSQNSTKTNMENIVRAFVNGDVRIDENISDYSFCINVLNSNNVWLHFDDIVKAVEDMKPAHLEAKYTSLQNENLDIFIGGAVAKDKQRMIIGTVNYNSYGDLKNTSYNDIKNKNYISLLCEEE